MTNPSELNQKPLRKGINIGQKSLSKIPPNKVETRTNFLHQLDLSKVKCIDILQIKANNTMFYTTCIGGYQYATDFRQLIQFGPTTLPLMGYFCYYNSLEACLDETLRTRVDCKTYKFQLRANMFLTLAYPCVNIEPFVPVNIPPDMWSDFMVKVSNYLPHLILS